MSTIRLYRIVHEKYADAPFSGEGGLYAASRWASRGHLVSYAAESLALAALEKIAGAGRLSRLGAMVYAADEVDADAVHTPAREDLPDGWNRRPPGAASRDYGNAWLRSAASVALRVPSVVLPESANLLLNPAHSAFEAVVTVHSAQPLALDPRVLERLE